MEDDPEIEEEVITDIVSAVFEAEKKQLHLEKPHNIKPEIQSIIENRVKE